MSDLLNADIVARAIIASAGVYGDSPVRAVEAKSGILRRCISPAIVGVARGLGETPYQTAMRLGLHYPAVRSATARGGDLFYRAVAAAKAAVIATTGLVPELEAPRIPAPQPELAPVDPVIAVSIVASVAPAGKTVAPPREIKPRARQLPRGARFENRGGGVQVIRMKPVTPQIVQRAKDWIARGMEIDELADMFDVSPDSLERKLNEAGVQL